MAKFDGELMKITIGGTELELKRSVTLEITTTEVECTNSDSAGYRELLAGTHSWTMSGSAYVDYSATEGYDEAMAALKARTLVTAVFTTSVSGDASETGTGYFTSITKVGELDSAAEWNFSITGTGALTTGTVA